MFNDIWDPEVNWLGHHGIRFLDLKDLDHLENHHDERSGRMGQLGSWPWEWGTETKQQKGKVSDNGC